ncbi:MAG: ATP-binding protein [Gemmatimonadota bacterium]
MTAASRLAALRSSLSVRLFLVLLGAVFLLSVVNAFLSSRIRHSVVEDEVRAGADQAAAFLEGSLLTEMRENNRDHIHEAIRRLGREPGVEAVRIYNKRGEIAFSSDSAEIGREADLRDAACVACHATDEPLVRPEHSELFRIYEQRDGDRVLGVIRPIHNEPGCATSACHAHEPGQAVLGVLDVQVSLASTDAALARAEQLSLLVVLLFLVAVGLLLAFIVRHWVYRRIKRMIGGTEKVAAGKLDVRLPVEREDEFGQLAASFNRMAASLQAANVELREWSETLAERVRDKTHELAAIHRQMVQVEKTSSLGKMAATVAHELNNPLSGILTCSRVVARRVEKEIPDGEARDRILESLDLIRSESMRCGKIVRDLLTYARGGTHELAPARLHVVVEHATNLMGHHLELGSVRLETDLRLEDDEIVCDGDQIVQALLALMINAVEAMPEGGELTLSTERDPRDDGSVLLAVADTGMGIPDEVRDRIFDPFFSTKNETKGVGLGLAVVYGIVRRHGGEISVVSSPGNGTRFTLRLPRRPGHGHRPDLGERASSASAAAIEEVE